MSGAALVNTAGATVTLAQWLRLLWNIAPPLRLNSDRPFITAGEIHLPPRIRWLDHTAAAAHAAAHLVYSPRRFDGAGLAPRASISRALMGLLEDARAEALAIRDLPALARLWRPWHTATPELGNGFEALMQRLARSLIDPDYDDPDPWVAKGRALFRGDGHHGESALRTPADVHHAATRLGHDIGQMRLQFNAKTYRPLPAYRDDHRWMWPAEVTTETPPPAATQGASAHDESTVELIGSESLYPEWDRLIGRLRPDWCRVIEHLPPATARSPTTNEANDNPALEIAFRLRRAVLALAHRASAPRRDDEGEVFDPGALVDRRVALRLRRVGDPRLYRGRHPRVARSSVWLLIDQSQSTAAVQGAQRQTALQLATASAIAAANALQAAGIDCAISGFSSHGRHAVRIATVKSRVDPVDAAVIVRAHQLRPGGSTRLGAALRHVTRQVVREPAGAPWLILLSDGEPYDVDVHDPRYLVEDARHAVLDASRRGVRVVCLALSPDHLGVARQIFGRSGVQHLRDASDLPRALIRLLIRGIGRDES